MFKLLLTCHIFFFSIFGIDGNLHIIPTAKYLELNSSVSFQLACVGPSKKEWNYPRKEFLSSPKGLAEVSNVVIEQSAENPNKSILSVTSASYIDTGAYQCLNGNDSVEIYVFVRDKDHLLMDAKTHQFAPEYSNFTLPCKPTARDVTVKLVKRIKRDFIELKVGEKALFIGAPVEYDIEKGFILPFVTSDVKGEYKCIATRGEAKREVKSLHVKFFGFTDSFNMPRIVANKSFVLVGDNIELECILLEDSNIKILSTVWDVPEKVKDYKQEKTFFSELIDNRTQTMRYHYRLHLKHVEMGHEGDYTCTIMDIFKNINKAKYHLKVHSKYTTFLNLVSDDAPVKIVAPSTNEQRIEVRIDANPSIDKMAWYFTDRKQNTVEIFDDRKYRNESFHESYATLIIRSPELDDSGIYRFSASNGRSSSHIDIKFFVEAMPEILEPLNPLCENMQVSSGLLFKYGTQHEISCLSIGYPKPVVSWYFQEFSVFPSLSGNGPLKIHSSNYKNFENNASFDLTTDSRLEGHSLKSGMLYCKSCNIFGCREANMTFLVTDIKMGFDTSGSTNLISGDNETIHCNASRFEFGPGLKWSYKSQLQHSQQHDLMYLNESNNIFVTDTETELSYLSTIVMKNVTTNLTGLYTCEAETFRKKKKQSAVFIRVKSSSFPVFLNDTSMNNGTRHVENDASFELFCDVAGLPKPRIVWFYNNKEISALLETKTIDKGRISLIDGDSKLKILHATEAESGNYTCKAINRLGSVTAHSTLIVAASGVNDNNFKQWPWIIFSTIFIIVILCVIIIILYQRVKHEKALLRELTKTVLETFDDGAEGDLNPDLGIVEQADLLPYKKQYEFPRENLKLGKQLGSGAFGVVLKAEANGIVKDTEVTTVAVKMLKQNVDVSHIKALTTELKVMIHLGKHLNVVNLLGACTRNLNNRELLVIVEYCKYGNMHDYLRKNRNNFINQINPKTGLFDSNLIGTRITETERKRLFPSQSTSSYTGATHSDSSVTFYSNCTVMTDFYSNQLEPNSRLVHNYKNLAVDPMDEEDDYIVSRDLLPALKPQSKGEHEFCTEDLLCWGFQTACGMEYLASRRVLHGDLAARNILLAENNVIKICDFGMSKNMNYDDNYCKKGKQLLPVKWLSIEAMRDREFSVYSDIWSFGVALWEFFSLARTPYPGIEGVQELYKKLESGYRMERPAFAPDIVYRIMLECWNEDPKRRPSFTDLAARLGYMIDRDVQKHFLNLSEQLLKSNEEDCDENDCLIQPSNVEYQNLIEKEAESSPTKNNKAVKNSEPMELKNMARNKVDSEINQCGFSNQSYGNVDLEQKIPSVNVQLV